ncbi:hypothetical protein, unlikely [Trypanosoma brucei gambiense DAL972]|uniref:Uncharacterized protein n=1 Tax=Trypanosoma brucei gambiense (strain MHOM/CI/86/DAL972) TaxID=679716 RepID=D0A9B5_TRYB9|nr:hypothetical protein, unlikely [Trypanosoma brucei gambiense DAL972]CBH18266.1 hypothetical protein, unlikely [Trypanosoma brucei gambiense DAL972]|eukprot:XP_011780530.1 hypothetical protein, unlikely [Trypanosoma brucei gambiense DAL972]
MSHLGTAVMHTQHAEYGGERSVRFGKVYVYGEGRRDEKKMCVCVCVYIVNIYVKAFNLTTEFQERKNKFPDPKGCPTLAYLTKVASRTQILGTKRILPWMLGNKTIKFVFVFVLFPPPPLPPPPPFHHPTTPPFFPFPFSSSLGSRFTRLLLYLTK